MRLNPTALLVLTVLFSWPASTAFGAANDNANEHANKPDVEISPGDAEQPPFPDALRDLIEEFKAQRQDLLAARQALVEALRNATEEERRALIDAFRKENRERLKAEKELRKEIRRRLQELRRQRRNEDKPGNGKGKGNGSG
jgi:Spy/CpxP family protein refolding chaperone